MKASDLIPAGHSGIDHRWWLVVGGLFIFVVTLLPFLRTLPYGFVNLDDFDYVVAHAEVAQGLSPAHVRWAFTTMGDGIWMPLTWLSYMLDCTVWGGVSPGAMRGVNIVLHGLNAVLLFGLLIVLAKPAREKGLWGRPEPWRLFICLAATLFWSLHPLRVEPVVWVASRKDTLFTFWELLALLAWLKRLEPVDTPRHRITWYTIANACFILAGLSKPTAMTFPILAGLLEYGATVRVRWSDYTIPLCVACAIGATAAHAQEFGGATLALANVSLYGRLQNAIAAFGIYCWKTVAPVSLAVQCQHRWPDLPRFWLPGAFICGAYGGLLVVFLRRLWRGARATATRHGDAMLLASLAFFPVAVAPTLGLSNFGVHAYADRFTYLPAMGFSILISAVGGPVFGGLCTRAAGNPRFDWIAGSARMRGGIAAALAVLAILTALAATVWHQTGFWRNDLTLFSHTLAVDGDRNVLANINLGMYHYEFAHDIDKAIVFFQRALATDEKKSGQIYPLYIICLCEAGRVDEARAAGSRLLAWSTARVDEMRAREGWTAAVSARQPRRAVANHVAFAAIAIAEGEYALAQDHIDLLLAWQQQNVFAYYLLGRMAWAQHDPAEAARLWRQALAFKNEPYLKHRFLEEKIAAALTP